MERTLQKKGDSWCAYHGCLRLSCMSKHIPRDPPLDDADADIAAQNDAERSPGTMSNNNDDRAAGDAVNHPPHYNRHPAGVECIDIVEHMPFNIGNAVKYLWRCGLKNDEIEELEKAQWYIKREIELRRSRAAKGDA